MPTTRPPSWQLADIIDYECFLNADERESPDALRLRDRSLFLEKIAPSLPPVAEASAKDKKRAADQERRTQLRLWLDGRREIELRRSGAGGGQEVILPGEAFGQVRTMARWWLIFIGLALGWGTAAAALAYSAGSEPINAFAFFVEFAVTQAVILLAAFTVLALRHWFPNWKIPSLMRLLLRIFAGTARNLWRKNRVRIAGATRQNTEAIFGILKARHTLYGAIFAWSLVLLAQAFAISFNVGVLGAMTTRHMFHDLDFGWESNWFSPEQIAQGARIAAEPWSRAMRPGHPSPEQVNGSQNRKRVSTARLDSESLKSWSQFLFGAVICYGLLPRVGLLLFAAWAQRGALARLRFGDGRSATLLARLRTPTVQTHGVPPTAAPARIEASEGQTLAQLAEMARIAASPPVQVEAPAVVPPAPAAASAAASTPSSQKLPVVETPPAPSAPVSVAKTPVAPVEKLAPPAAPAAREVPAARVDHPPVAPAAHPASVPAAQPSPAPAPKPPVAPPPAIAPAPAPVPSSAPVFAPAPAPPKTEPAPPLKPIPVQPPTAPAVTPAAAASPPAPITQPKLAPAAQAPPAPVAPPKPAPAPAARPAVQAASEPLLVLNLTGLPFTPAQAGQVAGHSGIDGAAPVSVYEAGTLSIEQDEQAFAAIKKQAAAPDAEVLALIPSWTSPMVASKLLLDQLRASAGRDRLITAALVGRPAPDGSFKPVRPKDRELWTATLNARGDAFLRLI